MKPGNGDSILLEERITYSFVEVDPLYPGAEVVRALVGGRRWTIGGDLGDAAFRATGDYSKPVTAVSDFGALGG